MLTSNNQTILQNMARELAPISAEATNRKGILLVEWLMMAAAFFIGSTFMNSLLG